MNPVSYRRAAAVLCGAVLSVAAIHAPAFSAPDIDQNNGYSHDGFSDESGIEPTIVFVNGEPGQVNVDHDPFGRLMTLASPSSPGYFYTTKVIPSSFSAWGKVYINFTAATTNDVVVMLHHGVTGAPIDGGVPGGAIDPLTLVTSDDPAYTKMALLPPLITSTTPSVRLRVALTPAAIPFTSPTQYLAPTIKDVMVTWVPKSLLALALEAPPTKAAGDGIVLRVSASVSFVNAKDFVAWVPAPTVTNDPYSPDAPLTFVSATEGGLENPGPGDLMVLGVPVPARSVYWAKPTLAAGNTFAYYATFRSTNGIEQGLLYTFQARVAAANSPAIVDSNFDDTKITSTAKGYLQKTSSGTFIIGNQAYTRQNDAVTMRLTTGDWLYTYIPNGAQAWNDGIVYDSVAAFLGKTTTVAPTAMSPGGLFHPGPSPLTNAQNPAIPLGVSVPPNSVWWDMNKMDLGQVKSLSYTYTMSAAVPNGTTINNCSNDLVPGVGSSEAWLLSGQDKLSGGHLNSCVPGTSCDDIGACHSLIIGLDSTPGFAFGKGDMLNGLPSIQTVINDNPNAFVTYGDPITFKLSVGNSALSKLNNVVMFDSVPAGTTFASAYLPPSANGTIYYYTGTDPVTGPPPAFFTSAATPATVNGNWTTNRASVGVVTWVAYFIPRLTSTYFPESVAPIAPSSIIADFTVTVNTSGQVCSDSVVNNKAWAFFPRTTPLSGPEAAFQVAVTVNDSEPVDVKPVLPNLEASNVTGPASANPGTTQQWVVTVYNHDRDLNQVDTALSASAVIQIPKVVANGVSRYLTYLGADSGGGSLVRTYEFPPSGGAVTAITVTWPGGILPQASKQVKINLGLPLGIRNADIVTLSANLSALDNNNCALIGASPNLQTTITSSPALEVRKDVDLTVVAPGTTYNYALRYINRGTAPSSKTWIIDRMPEGISITAARGPVGGEVWFAKDLLVNQANPGLGYLTHLDPNHTFDDAFVRAPGSGLYPRFTKSTTQPDPSGDPGLFVPPADPPGTNPPSKWKWVAFLVDDPNFDPAVSPAILGVGLNGILDVEVLVSPATPIGTTLQNEALIDSAELLQSIGNRVVTVVSGRPGLDIEKTCPEVISSGEDFTYRISWINDTTNQDDIVTVVETFPNSFVPNDLDQVETSTVPTPSRTEEWVPSPDGPRLRVTWTFPPQGSLGEAYIEIPGSFVNVTSNVFKSNDVVGIAENAAGTFSTSHTCTTLVQNPELQLLKLVDITDPRRNDEVTYTLTVSNEHGIPAYNAIVLDTLPTGLSYVGGSLQSQTAGWTVIDTGSDGLAQTLQLRFTSNAVAVLPGYSGPITATFRAKVGPSVNPGTPLLNTATVMGFTPDEDPPGPGSLPNTATALVTTPLPDPYISMTGPVLVKPGENLTWNILYGNGTREDADHTVILLTFPQGPTSDLEADFSYVSHSAPNGVSVYCSENDLGPPSLFPATWTQPPTTPPGGWVPCTTALDVNYMLFVIDDLLALTGPFPISVTASAITHTDELASVGGAFTADAQIGMVAVSFPEIPAGALNNFATVTTRTPSTDMTLTVECVPDGDTLGLPPGEISDFTFTIKNTGTVNAYGISINAVLDGLLTLESHSASAVFLTSKDGNQVGPVDTAGVRIETPVSWSSAATDSGAAFYLGNLAAAEYRQYGLRPGDSASITMRARVDADTLNKTSFESIATVATAGRGLPFVDGADEVPSNNSDLCGSTVYRADPYVIKRVTKLVQCESVVEIGDRLERRVGESQATGTETRANCGSDEPIGLAEAGDTLQYTVQFGNAGNFAASGVVISDAMPAGTTYVSGSLAGVPAAFTPNMTMARSTGRRTRPTRPTRCVCAGTTTPPWPPPPTPASSRPPMNTSNSVSSSTPRRLAMAPSGHSSYQYHSSSPTERRPLHIGPTCSLRIRRTTNM